jgi:6-phosphogluconolactonase/glucosamine-6-phosphate isomerase/deaminase
VLSFAIDGVEPRANPGEAMHIENTSHPANARLALAQAREMQVSAFGITETILGQGNNGHFAPFDWSG